MTNFKTDPYATNSTLWVAATLMSELISEAPSEEVARCLCEQVRELTGARTVILMCHDEQIHEKCRMLYVCPPRRSTLFSAAEFSRFCPNCTSIKIPVKLTDMLPDHPLYKMLSAKKVESILRFPTMSGGKMNGALILLDLPEPDRIDDIRSMMDLLGPFFGVALQNALTQQQIRAQNETLEEQVKARTAQLAITQFSIDNFADVVCWINQSGQFIYANKAAVKSLGYSKSELLQLSVMDIDPDFSKEDWAQYWNSRKSAGTRSFESRHKTKDGRIFPVEIHLNYLQFGDTEYACAFAHDISERKQAEMTMTEQLNELNRWHHVMMGRENRVIEIKREVNQLLARLNEPPRYASAIEKSPKAKKHIEGTHEE